MHLTVLAAAGATGLELTRQALERGHTVTAIARAPQRIAVPDADRLVRVAADVHDRDSIASALQGSTTVLSALGTARGSAPGVLAAGAHAAVRSGAERILWMGAFGTGASAPAAGAFTRTMLRMVLRAEIADKVTADTAVLDAGGTVFHCGPLSDGPRSQARLTLPLDEAPRRLFPARVSRATVAAAMLDEAEARLYPGLTVIPVDR
jgi:uncharacterized protein YbjT (DUF2867 family)